jgi:hypothetical protein
MACGPQAHLDGVSSLGLQTEGLIEGCHFIDGGHRDIETLGDLKQCLSGEIVHPGLKILQDADKRRPLITMVFNDFANDAQIYLHLISRNAQYCLNWEVGFMEEWNNELKKELSADDPAVQYSNDPLFQFHFN